MKQKQNKRWLMLLSVLSAFLVWLGVVNVADPVMTDTVEVPVEIVNDAVLTANNLTYEIVGKKTATISYEVKTTNAHRMRASDFRAYADMTEMWEVTGSIPVKVEVLNHGDYLVSTPTSRMATIKIATEPLQKKQFAIAHTTVGTMEEDYEPGIVTLSPATLYVEGPESLIGQISSVGIEIPVDGVSAEVSDSAVVKYYDANNNEIPLNERIKSDVESVSYHMTVLKGKNLTLDFQISGAVASGYRFTGIECEVKSVPVVGLRSVLASIHTLTIPGDVLNLGGASTNVVKTVDISDYLPEGVSLADGVRREINVTLMVEALEERVYTVEINDASYVGENDAFVYRPTPDVVHVTIRALREELDSLSLESQDLEVNVSSMTEGTHTARAALHLDQAYEVVNITPFTLEVLRIPDPSSETGTKGQGQETAGHGEAEEPSVSGTEVPESGSGTLIVPADAPAGEPGHQGIDSHGDGKAPTSGETEASEEASVEPGA